ncbi:hypothetical protein [Georgenia sp. H159]|uniref:hypothetical protein n=1 Tax=Georgenia sp. H159 TaxID=3076115 RepID=UPI002D77B0DD|nr:hypothetical protein [Georgenia sp. H159]
MADTVEDPGALAAVARELYAHVPAEFVTARNARAAEARRDGDRELARRVKALPKASVAAWAVLAVARQHPEELDALGELGAELRVAQARADPAELRALGKRRRQLTSATTRTAARLADERDVGLSAAAREQVEATWQAVVIDPGAERAVRSLLLVRTLDPGDPGALADALAVPGAFPAEEDDDGAPAAPPVDLGSRRRTAPAPRRDREEPGTAEAPEEEVHGSATAGEPDEVVWSKGGLTRRHRRDAAAASSSGDGAAASPPRDDAVASPSRDGAAASPPRRPDAAARRPCRVEPEPSGPGRAAAGRGEERDAPAPSGDVARERRRVERQLRARERAAEQARTDLEEATEELARVEAEVLRVAARIEELRRELGTREDELAGLDEDRAAAREEREDAEDRADAAERAVEETRTRLAELAD